MPDPSNIVTEAEPHPWAGVERRGATRYPIIRRCFVRLADRPAVEGWRCIAFNVSATGIGLAFPLPLRAGSVIEIEGWRLPGGRPVRATVVRTQPVEYVWFCGCEFEAPLEQEQLYAWVNGPAR